MDIRRLVGDGVSDLYAQIKDLFSVVTADINIEILIAVNFILFFCGGQMVRFDADDPRNVAAF